eukprot:SM006675S20127  [mRNA]  locus=s6675:71:807:+ [translate_table: standard]
MDGGDDDDDEGSDGSAMHEPLRVIQGLASNANQTERSLLSDVLEAVETAQEDAAAAAGGAGLRRAVMGHLRGLGYDAAICHTQWDHSKGFPGGEYEYIVVLGDEAPSRDRLL